MNVRGKSVFITGATGFIGGALARALVREGADVHALARPNSDRRTLNDLPITWHEGDVTAPASLEGLAGAEWIIHAAGKLGQAGVGEEIYQQIHVEGTRNVLAAALACKRELRVLYISSPGVLGPIKGQPAAEDAPLSPSNIYERTKAAAEKVAKDFAAQGLPVVIARPEFAYGPGDRHVLKLFQTVSRGRFFYIDGGRHLCHPTFIDDAVRGLLLCLSDGKPGGVYHITGPRPVTFRELGDTIAAALGVRPPWLNVPRWAASSGAALLEAAGRVVGKTPPLSRTGVEFFSADRLFSWQKAHRELGYTPARDLAAGVGATVAWYRQQGWL